MSAEQWPVSKMVEVEWIDSAARGRWDTKEEYEKLSVCVCRTAGYVLRQDRKEIVIVQNQASHGDVSGATAIPMVAIAKIRRLK